jgi:hypothetical protein
MILPPKNNGEGLTLPDRVGSITIVGANGSGKTRFTEWLQRSLGEKSFRLSALEAICYTGPAQAEPAVGTVDAIYAKAMASGTFLHADANSMFERLMLLLLNEEMVKLVQYKVARVENAAAEMEESKLDVVIKRWQEVFPDNHVLREGGSLTFMRDGEADRYSSKRLSQGEKVVLYYFGAVLYAPDHATVFVENPGLFLHPSLLRRLWDTIEAMRPDCRFVYTTHDVDFTASRSGNVILWVRSYDSESNCWDYDLLPANSGLSEDVYITLLGARRPVMFIEGDATHSIDSKLYPLIFKDYSVKALGSCNKVIEATRAFNDLKAFHHLESRGIVDRDRRDEGEVRYLREKNIYVPDVAEIENILMLPDVVRAVAHYNGCNAEKAFERVKANVIKLFKQDYRQQALQHTRHRVKRTVEYRIDGRFTNINALEEHMQNLITEINPRGMYEKFCRQFAQYASEEDYQSILRVYNQKTMVPNSGVSALCGLSGSKDAYVQSILAILKTESPDAAKIRSAIIACFGL